MVSTFLTRSLLGSHYKQLPIEASNVFVGARVFGAFDGETFADVFECSHTSRIAVSDRLVLKFIQFVVS